MKAKIESLASFSNCFLPYSLETGSATQSFILWAKPVGQELLVSFYVLFPSAGI